MTASPDRQLPGVGDPLMSLRARALVVLVAVIVASVLAGCGSSPKINSGHATFPPISPAPTSPASTTAMTP